MKKSLLAVALLTGFAGVASAQNSVTLYGIVDIGYRYSKTDDVSSKNEMRSNASTSRFGLRGSEDLGGGLNAVFKLENGFDSSTGKETSGRLFGRDAYLGLQSNSWGMVTFGRRSSASGDNFDQMDPFGGSFGNANFGNAFVAYDAPRVNNSIQYSTPDFNGFSGAVSYSLTGGASDEVPGGNNNTRSWSLMGQYKSGPLQVMATYDYVDYANLTDTEREAISKVVGGNDFRTANNADFWQIGANYDFGVAKLYAAYGNSDGIINDIFGRNIYVDLQGDGKFVGLAEDTDAWLLGVTAPIGANGTLMASYYTATDWDIDAFNVGYKHALSKRTDLYTFYSHANNVDMARNYENTGSRNDVHGGDVTTNQFAVGIRHRF